MRQQLGAPSQFLGQGAALPEITEPPAFDVL